MSKLRNLVWRYLDKWFPPSTPPAAPKRPQGKRQRAARPVTPSTITYEAWRDGKMGYGDKVTAPRGKGQDWVARLYCERQIERAKYYRDCDHSTKQLRTGSYNHRRRHTMKAAHRLAWDEGLKIAEDVYVTSLRANDDSYWPGAKELVQEAFGYTSYMLALAGD